MVLGYLTLSVSAALIYSVGLSVGESAQIVMPQLLAVAAVCGLGFATLSGYIVGLAARRAPFAHTAVFSLILIVVWAAFTFLVKFEEPSLLSALNIAIALAGVMTGGWIRYAQMQAAENA